MKKYVYPIITSGMLIFIVACSSGKYAGSEQNEIEKDNTIIIDSMSSSQLNKLLDDSEQNLVITTDETKILVQKVIAVNDSSVTILGRPDDEEYEKKVEKFRKDYFEGKVTSDDYPKREPADTLEIAISSIQSINYTKNVSQKGSEDKLNLSGGGYELDARKNELTLGLFVENRIGLYRPIIEFNTTFNNSTDKLRTSSSALYSLGYTVVGLLIGSVITGDPILGSVKKKEDNTYNILIWTIVALPLMLTNAEHHIYLIDPSNSNSDKSVGLSVFTGFRLDIYDSEWIVYSPEAGIQIGHYWGKNDFGSYSNSMDFQIGIEYPYEDRLNEFQEPKISAGVKFKFLYLK